MAVSTIRKKEKTLHANILMKRSPKGIRGFRWQKRMFRLFGNRIEYSTLHDDTPLGEIPLVCITQIVEAPRNKPARFDIIMGTFRTFELQATTPAIAKEWIDAIHELTENFSATDRAEMLKEQQQKFWKIQSTPTNKKEEPSKQSFLQRVVTFTQVSVSPAVPIPPDAAKRSREDKPRSLTGPIHLPSDVVPKSAFVVPEHLKDGAGYPSAGEAGSMSARAAYPPGADPQDMNRLDKPAPHKPRLSCLDILLPTDISAYKVEEEFQPLKHSQLNAITENQSTDELVGDLPDFNRPAREPSNTVEEKHSDNFKRVDHGRPPQSADDDEEPPYGKVAIVSTDTSDALYLLQVISKDNPNYPQALHTMNEMAKIMSPYVITQLRRGETLRMSWASYNCPANGCLTNVLHLFRNVSVASVRILIAEVVCALEYLHEHGFNFPNLSPETIWISHKSHLILADFAFALPEFNEVTNERIIYRTGPLFYAPPEFLKEGTDDCVSDWWRLGVLVYHLIVGTPPFIGNREEVCSAICRGDMEELLFSAENFSENSSKAEHAPILDCTNQNFDPTVKDLILRLLDRDRNTRLGAENSIRQLKKHPFFRADPNFSWGEVTRRSHFPAPILENVANRPTDSPREKKMDEALDHPMYDYDEWKDDLLEDDDFGEQSNNTYEASAKQRKRESAMSRDDDEDSIDDLFGNYASEPPPAQQQNGVLPSDGNNLGDGNFLEAGKPRLNSEASDQIAAAEHLRQPIKKSKKEKNPGSSMSDLNVRNADANSVTGDEDYEEGDAIAPLKPREAEVESGSSGNDSDEKEYSRSGLSRTVSLFGRKNKKRDKKGKARLEKALTRKANSLFTERMRAAVSKKKKRFIDEVNDVNLDLTYITKRIIAMGYPAEGKETMYRNPMVEVQRFFNLYHPRHFKVYNLCIEKDRQYHHSKFTTIGGEVANYQFKDHNAPELELILEFCVDIHEFLSRDKENTVAIHCKAGKGRTGTMICSYLYYANICKTPELAVQKYGEARTKNAKGVTIPSQRRYVYYFCNYVLKHPKPSRFPFYQLCILKGVRMNTVPNFDFGGGCDPYFLILNTKGDVLYDYSEHNVVQPVKTKETDVNFKDLDVLLSGSFKVVFFDKDVISADDIMCWCWLHSVVAATDKYILLTKDDIDGAVKDKKGKKFDEKFTLEFWFDTPVDEEKETHYQTDTQPQLWEQLTQNRHKPGPTYDEQATQAMVSGMGGDDPPMMARYDTDPHSAHDTVIFRNESESNPIPIFSANNNGVPNKRSSGSSHGNKPLPNEMIHISVAASSKVAASSQKRSGFEPMRVSSQSPPHSDNGANRSAIPNRDLPDLPPSERHDENDQQLIDDARKVTFV